MRKWNEKIEEKKQKELEQQKQFELKEQKHQEEEQKREEQRRKQCEQWLATSIEEYEAGNYQSALDSFVCAYARPFNEEKEGYALVLDVCPYWSKVWHVRKSMENGVILISPIM